MLLQTVFPFYMVIIIGIYPHTDIIYDYRLGDGDNVDANEDVQGKANEVLFDLINQGSYLVLRIKS